jgi:hypothetical protein
MSDLACPKCGGPLKPDGTCPPSLGLAKFRVQDYAGTVGAFDRARQMRSNNDYRSIELAFKAMALARLGRSPEAAAAADQFRALVASEPTEEMKTVARELAATVPTPFRPSR